MRKRKNPEDEFLWVEKYRPQTLDECILPDRFVEELRGLVDGGEIHNLLLCGGPGIGKTTVAKALCNDMNADVLLINASKDGNIDTLRTTIQNFAMSKSFEMRKKVCILDEADYLNANSTQPALRNFIEEFSHNCRFILTCNYPKRIIEPLHSRLREIHFNFDRKEQAQLAKKFLDRFCTILTDEGKEFDKKAVAQLILKYTPDYRKILNELQGLTSSGTLDTRGIGSTGESLEQLADWVATKKFTECRNWIAEHFDVGFAHFMKIRTHLESKLDKQSIPDMFVIINEFDVKSGDCTDMEVHMTACIVNLMFELEYK